MEPVDETIEQEILDLQSKGGSQQTPAARAAHGNDS
jgi:hypothetical protein